MYPHLCGDNALYVLIFPVFNKALRGCLNIYFPANRVHPKKYSANQKLRDMGWDPTEAFFFSYIICLTAFFNVAAGDNLFLLIDLHQLF